jgi:hypothetical protein
MDMLRTAHRSAPWEHAAPLSRRQALRSLGSGFGMLGLAAALADGGLLSRAAAAEGSTGGDQLLAPRQPHFTPRAKRVIFLFMNGGPSHVDTFDRKPALEKYAGQMPSEIERGLARPKKGNLMPSPFAWQRHGAGGVEVSELFPRVAGCIDDLCIIRSMYGDDPNHEPGLLMMNSGNPQPIRPSLGSWLSYALGTENQNLPSFVVFCPGKPVVGPQLWSNSFLPGVHQGTHINNRSLDPSKVIAHLRPAAPPDVQRRQLDLLQSINREHLQRRGQDDQLEARIAALELAFRMQSAGHEAFDLSRETKTTREAYGTGHFAETCLVTRRLIERGVRMVQIYYGDGQPWDDHSNILNHRNHAQATDQPIAALLADLKARGLLDETLVIWGGEFGRTPTAENGKGRDHHTLGFTMWLAGGGVRGGLVYGATDEFGFRAVENRVHIHDLHATVLHLLGLDHTRLTYRYSGRDFRLTDVHGRVVTDILS